MTAAAAHSRRRLLSASRFKWPTCGVPAKWGVARRRLSRFI
ncbi:hypothetical protein P186_0526 [Pyrobaculum ferrireducens]|uniref:Uncharacterized protein n=1 Tax=Pyrobaculum ferrireducens TaxID=1104324 RepID=G7VH75_9CREN|nr:hypothetical protein P186_0526 [Pyrobaculum ferrireducens]